MMSGAEPPWNCVTSWSWTESQLPWTYSTWMSGFASFHSSTIACDAATVGSWKARLWNRSVTGPALDSPSFPLSSGVVPLPPDVAQPARSRIAAAAATHSVSCIIVSDPASHRWVPCVAGCSVVSAVTASNVIIRISPSRRR